MSLTYCPRCSKLFAKGVRDVCNNCFKEIENEYDLCVAYLKEHRRVSLPDLSDATGVSLKQIYKFMREGRISASMAPNASIPCEVCGKEIREGSMCDSCRSKLQKDFRGLSSQTQQQTAAAKDQQKTGGAYQIRDRL